MTDTSIDGKVQRVQAMLYRPSRLEPGYGESRTSGSAVEGWGNTSVVRLKVRPVPTITCVLQSCWYES